MRERTVDLIRGVNVLGYHHVDSGLGVAARSIAGSLRAAGIDVTTVDVANTDSPLRSSAASAPAGDGRLHPTTIAVVTALQLPDVIAEHPDLVAATELLIGYWFWELATVPETHRRAIELVDQIWAPTRFVADAYRAAGGAPVELQPIYVPAPQPSTRQLAEFGVRAGTVFLTSFDHFSVTERKNPAGVVSAFDNAFPRTANVALVIKTLNGDLRPDAHQRLVDAAADDRRIVLIDEHLSDADLAALIAGADCFVSLHRSEGLGLHLADAMWLDTTVLATRYSGNLDLMDDRSAALVDVRMIPVRNGEGAYPDDALWADPDLDLAAQWMRRLAVDRELREELATAAKRRMVAQPSPQEVGRRMLTALTAAAAAPVHSGPIASALRKVARTTTSPVRNYFNSHFEMTKQEVRALQAGGAADAPAIVELDSVRKDIVALAQVVSEVSLHQTRMTGSVRDEISDLRDEIAQLRNELDVLTKAIIHLVDRPAEQSARTSEDAAPG